MLWSKVNVTLHFVIIGCMTPARFCLGIIRLSQFHRINIIRVRPGTFSGNHFPPHTDVFHRLNPGNIFVGTRFIQVQSQFGSQNITSIITDNHRAPGWTARRLHITFIPFCIRSQPWFKNQVLIVKVQMHTRIINQSRFMQIDIQPVGCLHLQRCLHTCWWKRSLRSIWSNCPLQQSANLWKLGFGIVIFLRIIIAWNPECRMIAGHSKLRMFFFYNEVIQILLLRELIAEPQAIIIKTKTNNQITILRLLIQGNSHFIIMVADRFHLSPHRFPCFIKSRSFNIGQSESIHQSGIIFQFQSQFRRFNHLFSFIREFIHRFSLHVDREIKF